MNALLINDNQLNIIGLLSKCINVIYYFSITDGITKLILKILNLK